MPGALQALVAALEGVGLTVVSWGDGQAVIACPVCRTAHATVTEDRQLICSGVTCPAANGQPELQWLGPLIAAARPITRGLLTAPVIFAPLGPVRWLCEALDSAPGAPLLVAGYGYSGKTLAMQDFALAVATGTPAWGRFPVRAGRVLHVDYEQGAYLTRMRYQRLARARGIDPVALNGKLVLASLPTGYIDEERSQPAISRLCEGFDFVLIDSFRAACPHTDENSSVARIPLDFLTRVSEETGASFAVIHHARKPSRDAQGGQRMTLRGSGALYDACGSLLILGREKGLPVAVSHEKARVSGHTLPDFRLETEDVPVGGDPKGGLRITYLDAVAVEVVTPDARFAGLKEQIVAIVGEAGFSGGVRAVRARLGGRQEIISAAVAELTQEGILISGGTYHAPTLSIGKRSTESDPSPAHRIVSVPAALKGGRETIGNGSNPSVPGNDGKRLEPMETIKLETLFGDDG